MASKVLRETFWLIHLEDAYPPYEVCQVNEVNCKKCVCEVCNKTRNVLQAYEDFSVREFETGVCLECALKDKSIIITKKIVSKGIGDSFRWWYE
jgi:hypothetical protein